MKKKISKITICITNVCNRKCSYCYRDELSLIVKPSKFIYWADLLLYLSKTKDFEFDDTISFCFTGGEPSLYFYDILEGIFTLRILKSLRNINVKFGMITNLSNPKDLLLLLDKKYMYPEGISISWDYTGDYKEETQINYLSDCILKYNDYQKSKFFDMYIKIAVTKYTVSYLYDGLKILFNNGFTNIGYYFVNGTNDYNNEIVINEFKNQLQKIKDDTELRNYIRNYNDYINKISIPYCGKLDELLYIDTAGNIWPCAFISNDSKVHGIKDIDKYQIGNIFNGLNKNRIHATESNSLEWINRFCPACSDECKNTIRNMKQIEINVFN